jgi:hypothetical protein
MIVKEMSWRTEWKRSIPVMAWETREADISQSPRPARVGPPTLKVNPFEPLDKWDGETSQNFPSAALPVHLLHAEVSAFGMRL